MCTNVDSSLSQFIRFIPNSTELDQNNRNLIEYRKIEKNIRLFIPESQKTSVFMV